MSNTESLSLILDAKVDRLEAAVTKSALLLDQRLTQMEKRATRTEAEFGSIFKKMGTHILEGVSLIGIEEFVRRSSESVETIIKQSNVLGLSTDTFQEWSIVAAKAGTHQEALNTALDRFTKNLGAAQSGTGSLKVILDQLLGKGTWEKLPMEEALYRLIDVANRLPTNKRDYVFGEAFGKGYAEVNGFLRQSSQSIREQGVELKANGSVIDKEVLAKVKELDDAWIGVKAQLSVAGVNVLGGFADAVHNMTGDFKDEKFQTALRNFGSFLGTLAGFLAKNADKLGVLAAVWGGAKIPGPPILKAGAGVLAGVIAYNQMNQPDPTLPQLMQKEAVAKANLAGMKQSWDPKTGAMRSVDWDNSGPDRIAAAQQDYDAAHAAVEGRKKAIAAAAWRGAHPEAVDGSGGNPPALHLGDKKEKNGLDEETRAALEQDARAAAAIIRQDAEIGKLDQESAKHATERIQRFKDEAAALQMTAGQMAAYEYVQNELNHAAEQHITLTDQEIAAIKRRGEAVGAAAQASADSIEASRREAEATDQLRSGLEGIGMAANRGIGNAKQALAGFIQQLVQTAEKIMILDPLMDSLFGKHGSGDKNSRDGLLTGVIHSAMNFIPHFADGTSYAPGGMSLVGERGPELVSLSPGAKVVPTNRLGIAAPSRMGGMQISAPFFANVQGNADDVAMQQLRDMHRDFLKRLPSMIRKQQIADKANYAGAYAGE